MPRSPLQDFGPKAIESAFDVSRETLDLLKVYEDDLLTWQRTINLIGPDTAEDVWRRHIYDSAQLLSYIPASVKTVVDMGSGAGFPGLVLALLLRERPGLSVHLIESHKRKSAFLRHVIGKTQTPAQVHTHRLEHVNISDVDLVTARALAPLDQLLNYAERYDSGHTFCLFLKGQNVGLELTKAAKCWSMSIEQHPSLSDPSGTILVVKEFHRVSKEA